MNDEFRKKLDVAAGILDLASAWREREHQHRRVHPKHVEQAERGRIRHAVRTDGRHQRNRARNDGPAHQLVLLLGVEFVRIER
jgi:hypothetical protein